VDNERSVLYTLSDKSTIEMIYLGKEGQGYQKMATVSNLASSVQHYLEPYPYSGGFDSRNFKIVSLHPISPSNSRFVHLMAVTNSG
jgi:nuclear pore complex protein Nup155